MLQTKENLHQLTDITLPKHQLWSMEGDRRGDVISCSSGILWVTQEGDLKDYVVEPGKDFWVTRPGIVVIQALEDASFKYSLNELQSHIEINPQPVHHSNHSRLSNLFR